jgi:predicted RNase H-like nuclease (RuvC/YqgF family)
VKYNYFQDPAHGWIEVPVDELRRLKIANKISPYSYKEGDIAYLEEDCDYSVWAAAKELANEPYELHRVHTDHDSLVRSFGSYR